MPEQQKAFNLLRYRLDAVMPKTVVVEYEPTIDPMVTFFERRKDPEEPESLFYQSVFSSIRSYQNILGSPDCPENELTIEPMIMDQHSSTILTYILS